MVDKVKDIQTPVEKNRAMEHALMTFRRAWAGKVAGFESWGAVELDPDPLVIYDLNGEPLFFEFSAMDGKKPFGRIKTAATKRIGATVPTVEFGPRPWDPARGTAEAKKKAKKLYPQAKIEGVELVCYSYPKIGVRVELKGKKLGEKSLIFDIADGTLVTRFGADEPEGQTAWSFLDQITPWQAEEQIRLWDLRDEERKVARTKTRKLFARGFTAKEAEKVKKTFLVPSKYIIPFFSSKILKFSPRCDTHDCFELYGQKTSVYCAVATGQMILDFYRYHFNQDDIATAMGTGAGGTSNSGQVAGYQSLSKNCLVATYDTSAAWSEAKAEIDANRPVKSGIPGHARACAGWKRQNIWIIGQPPKRWLQIYDPWPWSADICAGGQVYWEDWNTVTHTNFIYVRHRATTCT
jgi:hypothetical protein